MVTRKDIVDRLEENAMSYRRVDLGDHHDIFVTEYGGRIFGPFDESGFCHSWANPVFQDSSAFKAFVSSREWNIGGERLWLLPEGQYNVTDDKDFWGSYVVPSELDPGRYRLTGDEYGNAQLSLECELDLYRKSASRKALKIHRQIFPAVNPFEDSNVRFFGYHHHIGISEKTNDDVVTEAWDLLQICPPGHLYIPTTESAGFVEYYESFRDGYQRVSDDSTVLKIDGRCQYKVGYKASCLTGRTGYLKDGEHPILMVRSHGIDPTGEYYESPLDRPDQQRMAFYVYNDGGHLGGFAEHECSIRPIGGTTERKESSGTITTLYFTGEMTRLHDIGKRLLGVKLDA